MNEIDIDTLDRIEKVLSWKQWVKGSVNDAYDEQKLYTSLFTSPCSDGRFIPDSSVFNIFKLLGAKPHTTDGNDRDPEYLKNRFKFDDTLTENTPLDNRRIDDSEEFLDQALAHTIEFINISVYIYTRLTQLKKKKLQSAMLKFLIVSASTIYDELYSSKGKIAFAYYFKKILQNHEDLNKKITPYNKASWGGDFSQFTREAKEDINFLLAGTDISKPFNIANIAVLCGKMTDPDLVPLEEKYFIEAGIIDYEKQDYNRIFITTFL